MTSAILRIKRWLNPAPPPPSKPISSARAQLHRIEWKLDRIAWHWTKHALNLPTSGPTAQISPTSTGISPRPQSPTTTAPTASPLHRTLLKKIGGWLIDRAVSWLLHIVAPIALSALALGRDRLDALWQWANGWWQWLAG